MNLLIAGLNILTENERMNYSRKEWKKDLIHLISRNKKYGRNIEN